MDTAAWVGIVIIAVVAIGMIGSVIPPIRKHREDRARAKAMDELHHHS